MMFPINLDRVESLCEKLDELHDSDEPPSLKKQRYQDGFEPAVMTYFRILQETATVKSDPVILLTREPAIIAQLLRDLIRHQPQENA